jgi:sugar phosphate isomerase/epimerase
MALLRAISSLGCPDMSLDEVIGLAIRHGLTAVELRALGGSLDLPAYLKAAYGSPEALARHLQDSAVSVVAFGTSLRIVGSEKADRESFLEFVPWAEALGVPRLRVFDGGKAADDAEIAQGAATVSWWTELRRERGWRTDIMVETHDSLMTAALIQRLINAVPAISILWDTHHTWKKGGEDPLETWARIKRHVCHTHVKDSISVPAGKYPYTYVQPGTGEFPAAPLINALRADKFAGPLSLEWEKVWHPDLPPLDTALSAAAANSWW